MKESKRIKKELDELGNEFAKNGVVRTVLRQRIIQEQPRELIK
jgi:hypothetical protein